MYDKILVPLDGSPTSDRGFEEAVALARALKSRLVLAHIIELAPVPVEALTQVTWEEISQGLREHGQSLLEQAHKAAAEHGVTSEMQLIEAQGERVADRIVSAARESRCDLVVMGTHGRRGFAHAFLGSDAERVLRQCPVPVLMVRHPEARKKH